MLPLELNKLLIIVVVLSMALTPFLNEAGRRAADFIDVKFDEDVCFCSNFSCLEFNYSGQLIWFASYLDEDFFECNADSVNYML